ncbi:MAG: hypothetical protein RIT24_2514 [Planctomycetota bacterium]|jgi:hypothetical protein
MRRTLLATAIMGSMASAMFVLTPSGAASGSSGSSSSSGSSRPALYTKTPGHSEARDAVNQDVLLDRIVFPDGTIVRQEQFVYPASVTEMKYAGPIDRFRRQNGQHATVGAPGIAYIDDLDGDGSSVSQEDLDQFCNEMVTVWCNNNLNNRILLQSQAGYSFIVGLRTRIWDSNWGTDSRPELFVFEDQGNSVMTIQALTDALEPVGTAVEVRAVDLVSIYPEKIWVGRWNQNGQPQSGTYEAKLCAIDLSRLGVTSGRFFRITTEVWGGGEASADLKIIAVDTSPGPAAQSLTFD